MEASTQPSIRWRRIGCIERYLERAGTTRRYPYIVRLPARYLQRCVRCTTVPFITVQKDLISKRIAVTVMELNIQVGQCTKIDMDVLCPGGCGEPVPLFPIRRNSAISPCIGSKGDSLIKCAGQERHRIERYPVCASIGTLRCYLYKVRLPTRYLQRCIRRTTVPFITVQKDLISKRAAVTVMELNIQIIQRAKIDMQVLCSGSCGEFELLFPTRRNSAIGPAVFGEHSCVGYLSFNFLLLFISLRGVFTAS